MALVLEPKGAQMGELDVPFPAHSSASAGEGAVRSGFLGCWPKRRTFSVHPGLSWACVYITGL